MAIPKPNLPKKMPMMPKPKKKFEIQSWIGSTEGEKILEYAITKMGKTTSASTSPDPVFIGVDDGGRKMKHPVTGKHLNYVPGIDCFEDVRAALHSDVFESAGTIVVDTITYIEKWAEERVLDTISKPKSQGGGKATNIHDYGYHEGFKHLQNMMCLLLGDFDRWIRKGKNVLLLAQETTLKWKTSSVEDFLMAGPELHHSRTASVALPYMSWVDHIFRISYANQIVTKGKIAPVQERAIQVKADATFFAGSRSLPEEYDIVEFKEPADDSIWRLLFNGK